MKLYIYEHCPFCVRAVMAAHYKQVPVEETVLLNNDEKTCLRLVHTKQVPILEFDNGEAMTESLDIARQFDKIGNSDRIIHPATKEGGKVTEQLDNVQSAISCLLFPRNVRAGLKEFATQKAIAYFQLKKEKVIGKSFEQALAETPDHKTTVEEVLRTLPLAPARPDGAVSWDDVIIFPRLRNLTIVKGLIIPPAIMQYINDIAERTDVALFFDKAS